MIDSVSGDPVQGARVRAYLGTTAVRGAITDADGVFVIQGLDTEVPYNVQLADPSSPARFPLSYLLDGSERAQVVAGTGPLTLQAVPYTVISGTVIDSVTGDPVEGIRVRALLDGQAAATTFTGPDGTFHLERLSGSTEYTVQTADTVSPARYPVTTYAPGSAPTSVPGGSEPITVEITPWSAVSGTVVDEATGTPLGNVRVRAMDGDRAAGTVTTGGDGTFVIDHILAGVYTIQVADVAASPVRFPIQWHDNTGPASATHVATGSNTLVAIGDYTPCDPGNPASYPGNPVDPLGEGADANCDGFDGIVDDTVFVASPGADNATCGAVTEPCRTIDHGSTRAIALGRSQVQVSNGLFPAASVRNGLQIGGGYLPSDWSEQSTFATYVGSAYDATYDGQVSLKATNITSPTLVTGLTVEGAWAPGGQTSYAMIVDQASSALVLDDLDIVGGRGGDGSDGSDGTDASQSPAPSGGNGANGFEVVSACNNTSAGEGGGGVGGGGNGGRGGTVDTNCGVFSLDLNARPGSAGTTGSGGAGGGGGGSPRGNCDSNAGRGGNGGTGATGSGGTGGIAAPGSTVALSGPRLVPGSGGGNGGLGSNGFPGGGGGGGGASDCNIDDAGAGGGGGGAGGVRAPAAGLGGSAGRPSVALYLRAASPSIQDLVIVGGTGGTGGDGGNGGNGQPGGAGGQGGNGFERSGGGGNGGNGGRGGASGGGAGGNGGQAVGIVTVGGSPVGPAPFFVSGTGGAGGSGGLSTNSGSAGNAGLWVATMTLP